MFRCDVYVCRNEWFYVLVVGGGLRIIRWLICMYVYIYVGRRKEGV